MPLHPNTPRVGIILLAAGSSSRMKGRDKLVEEVWGTPLLRHSAIQALESRADKVAVILRPDDLPRRDALEGLAVTIIENPSHGEGMASSIRTGLGAMSGMDGAIIALADMPDITARSHDRLIEAFSETPDRIIRAATPEGRPANPVLFPRNLFDDLERLTGDRGARDLLRRSDTRPRLITLPGSGVDLDTEADWQDWLAQRVSPDDRSSDA